MNKPDSILVRETLNGDRDAFRQIVENTQGMVYKVAYRFLRQPHEAEDAVQEAYLRLFRSLGKYRPEMKLSTWLYRIVSNYCLDIIRSSGYKARQASLRVEDVSMAGFQAEPLDMETQELHDYVLRATEKLTPVQRSIFVLRDLEGLPVSEVEQILSMKPDSIKSNLYHARKRMSHLLKPLQNEM